MSFLGRVVPTLDTAELVLNDKEWKYRFMNETKNSAAKRIDWNDLAAFLAIAQHGGLTAAAREIGSSAPTLGRRMRALERSLGRELFIRRTHSYDLTEEGARLRADLLPAEATIAAATVPHTPDHLPTVRVAAGTWTMLALVQVLPSLIGTPADLRLRLLQGEAKLSIPRREAAIGFRSSRPRAQGLAGRLLRKVTFAPYAVDGAPAEWIVVRADTPSAQWVVEQCAQAIAVETDAPRLAMDLALQGMGRVVLPTFLGDKDARLVRVGEEIDALSHDQWLVTHDQDRHLPEVRRVLDRIERAF